MIWRRLRRAFKSFKREPFFGDYTGDSLSVRLRIMHFLREPAFAEAWRVTEEAHGDIKIPDIRWRAHICCWAASHGLGLEGAFVECGVHTGVLSKVICHYLDFNKTGKSFYLFDTFDGIPLEGLNDRERAAAELTNRRYFDSYEIAKRHFAPFPKAELVKGRVPDTFGKVNIDRVSYLSIDMNNATAELAAMEYLWDKLSPSAIVVLDDYGWMSHEPQRTAMDDFAVRNGKKIASLPTGQGLLIR